LSNSRCVICVHLRSSAANSGFDGSRWAGGKDIWPVEDSGFQFIEGLDPDMAQKGSRHLAEQSLDDVQPGAVFRREDVLETVRVLR